MADQQEPQDETTPENLAAEFENLGRNLKETFLKLWESEQRKNLQKDLEEGLSKFGESVNQAVKEIQESSAGQQVKTSAEDFQERLRSGEVGDALRSDLVKVLRKINEELERMTSKVSSKDDAD